MRFTALTRAGLAALILAGPTFTSPVAALELFVTSDQAFRVPRAEVERFDLNTGTALGSFVSGVEPANPHGIAFGPDGNLYVVGASQNRILRYSGLDGSYLGAVAGFPDVQAPNGAIFGTDGLLYVDTLNGISRYDAVGGTALGLFASAPGLVAPSDLTFGPDGDVYTTSNSDVYRFDGRSGAFKGRFTSGGGAHSLLAAQGLAFGPDGDLYVADSFRSEVERFDGVTGAFLDTFAFTGTFNARPDGIAFGPDGAVYVAAATSILRYDTTGRFLGNVAQGGFHQRYRRFAFRGAPVPEPSTLALVFSAAPLVFRSGKRRSRTPSSHHS